MRTNRRQQFHFFHSCDFSPNDFDALKVYGIREVHALNPNTIGHSDRTKTSHASGSKNVDLIEPPVLNITSLLLER